jgi:hypothetical protein
MDVLGQILGDLADGKGKILLVIDFLLQFGEPPRVCFLRYSNHDVTRSLARSAEGVLIVNDPGGLSGNQNHIKTDPPLPKLRM